MLTADTTLYGVSLALRGIEEAAQASDFAVAISVLDEQAPPTADDLANRFARPGEPVLIIAFNAPGKRTRRTRLARPADRFPGGRGGGAAAGGSDRQPAGGLGWTTKWRPRRPRGTC